MKKILAALAAAVLALTLSSCGGNDDAKASKAISDQMMASQKSSSGASQLLSLKQKEADCIGDGMVDKIGTDQLQEYKILTKDSKTNEDITGVKMSKDDAKATTDVFFDCTDIPAMMQKAMESAGQIPDEMKDCVNKQMSEENLRPFFEMVFSGQQEQAQQGLIKKMTACASGSGG
jgi:hypothetical protein